MPIPGLLLDKLDEIERIIGYPFRNRELLGSAFIHRSYANEHPDINDHNERMEFLGDSVLGLLSAEYLYTHYPQQREGRLSFLRSRLVEAGSCATYVTLLDVERFLMVGRGELINEGRHKTSLKADLFEALIAAIYLDGGLAAARHFFFTKCTAAIEEILQQPESNWKALLQDYCQRQHRQPPDYRLLGEEGPDHSKRFEVAVYGASLLLGKGCGSSKKAAQQQAAEAAVRHLREAGLWPSGDEESYEKL